jgi:hypothetical protein
MIRNFLAATSLMALMLTTSVSTPAFAGDTTARHSYGMVGREVAAPSWSAACMTDHGPSRCDEPMWVYGSPAAVSRYKSAF